MRVLQGIVACYVYVFLADIKRIEQVLGACELRAAMASRTAFLALITFSHHRKLRADGRADDSHSMRVIAVLSGPESRYVDYAHKA